MKTLNAVAVSLWMVAACAGVAGAAPLTWNLTSSGCSASGSTDGNTRTCAGSVGAPSVTASAWSNTGGTDNTLIENALLETFSGGLGVRNRDRATTDPNEAGTPQHAVDNMNRYDAILLSFLAPVTLTELGIGYFSGDSDVTVLAFLGGGVPSLSGQSYGALTGLNWGLVGHYADLSTSAPASINAGKVSSMYWLVGAYNPTVGGLPVLTDGNDAVKFKSLGAEAGNPVPEPATLALIGTGLCGAAAAERRRRSRS